MARVTGININGATSSQSAANYVDIATTAVSPSTGTGLRISFTVNDSNEIVGPINFISGGSNYQENDQFTVNGHGSGAVMIVQTVSALVELQRFTRTYIKVQPNNLTGPPTYNLTDRDLYASTIIGGGGTRISGTGVAAEAITAGQLVYAYDGGGSVPSIRLASAAGGGTGDYAYQMNAAGIALGDASVGATMNYARNATQTINPSSVVAGAPLALTPGDTYYLSIDPAQRGMWTPTPPTTRGNFLAACGTAASATDMIVEIQSIVSL